MGFKVSCFRVVVEVVDIGGLLLILVLLLVVETLGEQGCNFIYCCLSAVV